MPQSRSKDKKRTPSFFELFSRLGTDEKKPPLVLNENTRNLLKKVEPPAGPKKKKKGK